MESANFCKRNGWTMATFQSDTEIDVAKDKVECNVYVGAISDGIGNGSTVHLGGRMATTMV